MYVSSLISDSQLTNLRSNFYLLHPDVGRVLYSDADPRCRLRARGGHSYLVHRLRCDSSQGRWQLLATKHASDDRRRESLRNS